MAETTYNDEEEGGEFRVSSIAKRARAYGEEKIAPLRQLIGRGSSASELHDKLTSLIAQVNLVDSTLDLDATRRQLKLSLQQAEQVQNEEELDVAKEQLAALERLQELLSSEDRGQLERILDRERLNEKEAVTTLEYMKDVVTESEKIGDLWKISIKDVFTHLQRNVLDERLGVDYRKEVLKEIADYTQDQPLFVGGEAAARLQDLVEGDVNLEDSSTLETISSHLESMAAKIATAEDIHEVTEQLLGQTEFDEKSQEQLDRLVTIMSEVDGFAEEQARLSEINAEGVVDNQEAITELKQVLSKLSDRTVETRTLHTLNNLNKNFDSAVLDTEELSEALQEGGLGQKFLENPAAISAGKDFAALLTSYGLQRLGPLGQLVDMVGGGDFLADKAGELALAAGGGGYLGAKILGRGKQAAAGASAAGAVGKEPGRIQRGASAIGRGVRGIAGKAVGAAGAAAGPALSAGGNVLRGVRGATSAVMGASGGAGGRLAGRVAGMARGGGRAFARFAGPAAGILTAGLTAFDYATAENEREREEALGEGAGALAGGLGGAAAGAAIGSVVPVIGTTIGAIIGGGIGAFGGGALGSKVSSWFSDPEDHIPDEVKEQGPLYEALYVDRMIASDSEWYEPEDVDALQEYRSELVSDGNIDSYLATMEEGALAEVPTSKRASALYSYWAQLGVLGLDPELEKSILLRAQERWSREPGGRPTPEETSPPEDSQTQAEQAEPVEQVPTTTVESTEIPTQVPSAELGELPTQVEPEIPPTELAPSLTDLGEETTSSEAERIAKAAALLGLEEEEIEAIIDTSESRTQATPEIPTGEDAEIAKAAALLGLEEEQVKSLVASQEEIEGDEEGNTLLDFGRSLLPIAGFTAALVPGIASIVGRVTGSLGREGEVSGEIAPDSLEEGPDSMLEMATLLFKTGITAVEVGGAVSAFSSLFSRGAELPAVPEVTPFSPPDADIPETMMSVESLKTEIQASIAELSASSSQPIVVPVGGREAPKRATVPKDNADDFSIALANSMLFED